MLTQGMFLVLCAQSASLAGAGFLKHGTVAEHRAVTKQMPGFGMANSPPNTGLAGDSPEAVENVLDYQIAMPTPVPAGFNGVYCRGGACQYRVAPPPPTFPPPITPPPMPIGGPTAGMEFCRGLSCIQGMGWPGDAALAAFNLNCVHLFNDVGGGMLGIDTNRNVAQVHESFTKVCQKRVGILEVGACPTYASTFMAVESLKVNNPTVGTTVEVCTDTYFWLKQFKQAEIDLKLTVGALPKANSLLAGAFARFGSGGNGPSSPRGLKWRAYVAAHGKWPTPPASARQLGEDGDFAAALLQTDLKEKPVDGPTTPPPLLPGADKDEDTPRGLPKYNQDPDCDKKAKVTPQSGTKYQIAPGSPDGAIGPVEVSGDLFTYCENQWSEIMMGFAQTAVETVKMTKGWCAWQASVSSWVGQKQEFGHPDWDHRTCTGMESLTSFALRDQLADKDGGLSATQVCKKIFLAIGSVHRTEALVKEAWAASLRGAPSSGIPGPDNTEMKKLLQEAQEYANKIFSQMRGQKAAYEDLNGAKMAMDAFDPDTIKAQAPPPVAPDLPDSSDVDPMALLSLSVERVKRSQGAGITELSHLKPWGASL